MKSVGHDVSANYRAKRRPERRPVDRDVVQRQNSFDQIREYVQSALKSETKPGKWGPTDRRQSDRLWQMRML